jgi:hypothetical protein
MAGNKARSARARSTNKFGIRGGSAPPRELKSHPGWPPRVPAFWHRNNTSRVVDSQEDVMPGNIWGGILEAHPRDRSLVRALIWRIARPDRYAQSPKLGTALGSIRSTP